MKKNSVSDLYKKYFRDIQFERCGLFKAIQQNYDCTTVLYPGSSIHITPSFYFPHVVYVDTHEVAQKFFADHETVVGFITSNKKYQQSGFIRFINPAGMRLFGFSSIDEIIGKDVYVDFDVKIGDNVKIQNSALVYHGVTVEDGGETHSNFTYVIDPNGIQRILFLPETSAEDIAHDVKILLAED